MREVLLRLEELLFLSASEIRVVSVQDDGDVTRIGVKSRTTKACCPRYGSWSGRVHGSYLRFPPIFPWQDGRWCCGCGSGGSRARTPHAGGGRASSRSRA
ncbi:hypothetical protein ACQSME_13655 [Streptomyces sp. 2-6]|uniref:hypothetical protein n=1 Tax=Streptomyces sp. 2-6 TaxID=2978333 RepID=UPI003D0E4555